MTYRLEAFAGVGLDEALLKLVIDEHRRGVPRLDKLWAYYRNPLQPVGAAGGGGGSWKSDWSCAGRWYRQSQECGLPARFVGLNVPRVRRHASVARGQPEILYRISPIQTLPRCPQCLQPLPAQLPQITRGKMPKCAPIWSQWLQP